MDIRKRSGAFFSFSVLWPRLGGGLATCPMGLMGQGSLRSPGNHGKLTNMCIILCIFTCIYTLYVYIYTLYVYIYIHYVYLHVYIHIYVCVSLYTYKLYL